MLRLRPAIAVLVALVALASPFLGGHPDRASAATFTVNSTGDGGDSNTADGICNDGIGNCTLRAAIQQANASPGTDVIGFNVPGAGPHIIQPASALPTVSDTTIIDGYTEPASSPNTNGPGQGSNAVLMIELSGPNPAPFDGLTITAGNSTVRGLVINNFGRGTNIAYSGILLQTNGGNLIEGNHIGIDPTGSFDRGNRGFGVDVFGTSNNTIGGTNAAARNIISGNDVLGVRLSGGSGNLVQGNYIGTDVNGSAPLGNGRIGEGGGVGVGGTNNTIGGTTPAARNIVSGNNEDGVGISGSGNQVLGNYIGSDVTGTLDLGNHGIGVSIQFGSTNTIGGTAAGARNVISGNDAFGVLIWNLATANVLQGNYIGTNAAGTAALGNGDYGVYVFWRTNNNVIGGTSAGAGNVISGNGRDGIRIHGNSSGAMGNVVQGNYIGTNAAGTAAWGNAGDGVSISDAASNNTVGGTTAASRNIISGNGANGVQITGSTTTGNLVQGNYIGTDVTGTLALANARDGVFLYSSTDTNTIGGTATGAGNIISGNVGNGVSIGGGPAGNLVQGNYIGTSGVGSAALGNGNDGVSIFGASNNTLGGTAAAARNIISGNGEFGVQISGFFGTATGNLVQGNYIRY